MKITGVFPIAGQVHVLMTDEEFSSDTWQRVRNRKKLSIADQGRVVVFAIDSPEVIVLGSKEFISFVVPVITDREVQDFIVGKSIEFG